MRAQSNSKAPSASIKQELSNDSQPLNDESGTYTGILGKRVRHEQSIENLRDECEGSADNDDEGLDSSERRERRYFYNNFYRYG